MDPKERAALVDRLANIADGYYTDHHDTPDLGIGLAGQALKEITDDTRIIRKALLESIYGSIERLNLRQTFELF